MNHPTDSEDCRDDAEMIRWFHEWQRELEYREAQEALPPHKRDDYAEKMAELGDHLNDMRKEGL